MSFGGEAGIGFDTARGRDWPSVRQFNVFVENRLGGLMDVVRRFEATDVRIISFTIIDSSDCAIIRLVVSDPERATEILQFAKMMFTESDLLVVKLPEGNQPLVAIFKALLSAEVSIHYAYPLMVGVGPEGGNALALHVADHEMASSALTDRGFTIYTENDLNW